MPVLFIGHGSPMNAIEDNAWQPQSWQALGEAFGDTLPTPAADPVRIGALADQPVGTLTVRWKGPGRFMISAVFRKNCSTSSTRHPAHPASGVQEISQLVIGANRLCGWTSQGWGLDHGAWSILKPMFPSADIPVCAAKHGLQPSGRIGAFRGGAAS